MVHKREKKKSQGLAHFVISETKKRVLSLIKEKGEKQSGEGDSVWDSIFCIYLLGNQGIFLLDNACGGEEGGLWSLTPKLEALGKLPIFLGCNFLICKWKY